MAQSRSVVSVSPNRHDGRQEVWRLAHAATRANSTWLDRLADLLLIFRRPIPVPIRTRRR
jgi:hypothetical protein